MAQDDPIPGIEERDRLPTRVDWAEAILAAEGPILLMMGAGRTPDEILGAIRRMVEALCDGASVSISIHLDRLAAHDPTGRAMPIRSSIGVTLGVLAFVRDAGPPDPSESRVCERAALLAGMAIERWRDETAIRRDEQRFRRLAEVMPQIVWTAGPDGTVDFFNRQWYDYTGMTPSETLENDGWKTIVHPDDVQSLQNARAIALGTGTVFESEFRLRDRDGNYRWHLVRSVPTHDESGRVIRRFGAAMDIDDRVEAERALRESESRFRMLADSIPQLAWMARDDGHIFWYNKRWYDYTGTTPERMEGWGWQSVHDPETLPSVLGRWRESIATGEPFDMVFPLKAANGEFRPFLTRVMPLKDEAGRIVRWVGTNTDVTDRIRMEASLKDADRRKDVFLATLAHELRNPLAPIRNALYLMKSPDEDGRGHAAERAMAERQVNHLARLVDDLMDVSRINEGKIELRKEAVILSTIIDRAVETVRSAFEHRGHEVTVSLPDEPIRLIADPTRLEQILWNLLNNAIKYTEPGGRIALIVGRDDDGVIVIRVRDTGIGIAAEMLPHVFEMFVQAGHRPGRSQGGLGIGLSLVRNLVSMHDGTISVSSEGAGRGSEFVVRLPDDSGTRGDPLPESKDVPEVRPAARRRILIVDDNRDAADTLARLLRRLYAQDVEVAYDGPSALESAESFRPELILLDIGMPGMDGYEVARRIRSRPLFDSILIVALTGWGQEQDRSLAKQAGFDRHFVKPIDPDAIRALLVEHE